MLLQLLMLCFYQQQGTYSEIPLNDEFDVDIQEISSGEEFVPEEDNWLRKPQKQGVSDSRKGQSDQTRSSKCCQNCVGIIFR